MTEKRKGMKRPSPIADLIAATFAGKPLQLRLREGRIWELWESAVGPQIAAKAMPASFRDGVLTVRVSGSAWMQQLSLMKGEITGRLNEEIGEQLVREIFFRQGSISSQPPEEDRFIPPARELTGEERAWIREQGDRIGDPELRRTLESLLTRHLRSLPSP